LKWCHKSELIPSPSFGEDFAPITRKAANRQKTNQVRKDISSEDLRAIIEASSMTFRPLVLLAINAGIGNLDLANMKLSAFPDIDTPEVWIDLPRGKTGTDRRFMLWPETVSAIREYLDARPGPAGHSNDDRLFLTRQGFAWVRDYKKDRQDAITGAFKRYRTAGKVDRGTFYDIRRTFQTVAAETLDFPAVSHVMGHARKADDMAAKYTQHISDDRIRTVCNYVRTWLYETAKPGDHDAK
jgi:integrase